MIKQLCGVALGALLALGASPGFAATASFTGATPATGNTCQYDTATIEATATDGSVTIHCVSAISLTAELKNGTASTCDYSQVDIASDGTLSVTCSSKPSCTLSASPSSVASGGSSTLKADCRSSSGGITYQWTGNGCTTEKTASCTVNPTIDTTYTVTATDAGGQTSSVATTTVKITSTAAPVCSVSQYPPNPVTVGSVKLTAECLPAATSYVWTGGQCLNGNIEQICSLLTPAVNTKYSVTGSNSIGKSTASATVEVSSTPTTPPSPTFKCSLSASPASISAGESSILTASCSPAAASYTWSGASCSGATCTVIPTATTAYTVTGKLGAETSSANASVTVVPKATTAPVCSVSQYPPNPVTVGSVKLTAECLPAATSYVWTGGQCLNGNIEQICSLLTPAVNTKYSVIGSNSFGKSDTAKATVEVSSSTSHACTLSATPSTVTLGQPVTLTVACSPGLTMKNYTWNANTGCPATGTTCAFTPPKAGTFSYNVTVNLDLGLTDTPTIEVTVNTATPSAKPTCTPTADPATPVISGSPVTLTANCVPSAGISYLWSSNTSCAGSATCTVTPTADTTYTVKGSNAGVESDLQSVSVKVIPAASYQGLWWNLNESGWGISVTQHDATSAKPKRIFAAIYTYDAAGQPTWYALSDCPMKADTAGRCTGDIYKVTGGSTPLVPWVGPVTAVSEGTGTFTFTDASHGQFDYTFKNDGVARSKLIEKLAFHNSTTPFAVDYTDLWWSEGESGWGVALTQDQGMIFAAWYAYDDQGNPVWYTASSCPLTGTGTCNAPLYRVTGGSPLRNMGLPSSPSWPKVTIPETKDSVTFTFSDKNHGEMRYIIDEKTDYHKITRFGF